MWLPPRFVRELKAESRRADAQRERAGVSGLGGGRPVGALSPSMTDKLLWFAAAAAGCMTARSVAEEHANGRRRRGSRVLSAGLVASAAAKGKTRRRYRPPGHTACGRSPG